MSIAPRLLILLLASIPALAIANGAFAQNLTAFSAAILLGVAAVGPQADVSATSQLLKLLYLAALFPILWMIGQIVPIPFSSVANSIWLTASTALGEPSLLGHVSVDPGATIRALIVYLSSLSLIVATTIIARDRKRAETIFLVLSTVTTFMSAEFLIGQFDAFAGMLPTAGSAEATTFLAMSMLSALANGAIIMMVMEGYLSRRELENSSLTPLVVRLALAVSGIAISLTTMKSFAPNSDLTAMVFGFAAILFVAVVRRLGFQSWPSVILFVVFAGIAATIAIPRFQNDPTGGIAGFAASATAESLTLAKRAMADAPWLGNGVGTFRSLRLIYQDFGTAPALQAPSTATAIAIEWGQPALAIIAAFVFQLFVLTFRGALRRGRDSFFSAAAAASILATLWEAFFDPSLLSPVVQIIISIIVGLGLAQSVGRTSGLK